MNHECVYKLKIDLEKRKLYKVCDCGKIKVEKRLSESDLERLIRDGELKLEEIE